MKIRITQTVNIDPQKWANEYGIDPQDVRNDVKIYFADYFQGQVEVLGLQPDGIKSQSQYSINKWDLMEADND